MAKTCDCIKSLTARYKELALINGVEISNVSLLNTAFMISSGETKTFQECEYLIVGVKRKYKVMITHNFCPFCGIEYSKEKEVING